METYRKLGAQKVGGRRARRHRKGRNQNSFVYNVISAAPTYSWQGLLSTARLSAAHIIKAPEQ